MITSKRDLKKHIDRIQDEVAQVVIPAAFYSNLFNEKEAEEALEKLVSLTLEAKERLNINFDKSPKTFDSATAYRKAKREYFKTAYSKALSEYEDGVNALLAPINSKK